MAFSIKSFFGRQEAPVVVEKIDTPTDLMSVMNFSRPEIPVIRESANMDWVTFGAANDYPQRLMEYTDTSAIHNAIVLQKSLMVAGSGFSIDGVSQEDLRKDSYTAEEQTIQNFISNGSDNLHAVVSKLAMDYELFGAYALEVVWSMDFSKIVLMKHVDVSKIRSGKYNEEGEVDWYYYSRNWANTRQHTPVPMQAFSVEKYEGKQYNQLLYVRNCKPGMEYYGIPSYSGALSWIQIDSQMGKFHLSNIENGFNPSMTVKFYQKTGSHEERQAVLQNIKKQFGGVNNTGKAMVFFSDGKELAPDIEAINVQNLDKQFIALADQAVSQILSGHRVTSPELMGIAVSGKLGNSDLPVAFNIFDKTVIAPDRNRIEQTLNQIAEINGINKKITLTVFNPLT